jgi:hypothetical protein
MSRRIGLGLLGALVLIAGARPAHAGDAAAAEALFLEAKKLAAAGRLAEACPKFAESNRLDRGAGTLLHLGDCYEKTGRTASAWATYKEAASEADAYARKDWAKIATQRASALEKRLARLTIKVDPANEKIDVTRDGAVVAPASFGVPIPVDKGRHTVEAAAAGFKPFETAVEIARDGERAEIIVPTLEREAPPVAPPVAEETAPPPPRLAATAAPKSSGGQHTIGFIVGGVGVAGLAAGAVTGLMALGKKSDAVERCGDKDGPCADRTGVDASADAKTFGTVSTIGFIGGGVLLAAGAALVFTAPREAGSARLRVTPLAGSTGGGLGVSGAF